MPLHTMTGAQLKKLIGGTDEFCLLDVREQGEFSTGHSILSSCLPLGRIEFEVGDLVPQPKTPIILMDNGPRDAFQRAPRAAEKLQVLGYKQVFLLEGGIKGWLESGYKLYTGVNVLSKAFGEFIESTCHTPHISPEALHAKLVQRDNLVVFDARPEKEYHLMNIPGAVNVPGSELVYRFFDMVPDPQTLVVVNCAGRTRSIIGAQSLINAGVPNPVAALENGTMGWHLANFRLEHGKRSDFQAPSSVAVDKASACAYRVAKRFGVKSIDIASLSEWRKNPSDQTLYLLDVRLPEEFEAGHIEGSRNAPGVQLVQATDEYVPVHNSKIVLVDDSEIRAAMTASWLIQLGWQNVWILSGGISSQDLIQGPHQPNVHDSPKMPTLNPQDLEASGQSTASSPVVLDVASSREYAESHLPGAFWIIHSRLAQDLSRVPESNTYNITSKTGISAHLTARELQELCPEATVSVLEGGTSTWINLGFPYETGLTHPASAVEDVWYKPYEHDDHPEKAMQEYIDWEVALYPALQEEGLIRFPGFD